MSKFRVKMKIQGFELEIEGAREDAALISRNVSQQMASFLKPTSGIIEIEPDQATPPQTNTNAQMLENSGNKARRRRKSTGSPSESEAAPAMDYKHSPEKYGRPNT
jgi:hypothetical protein